MAVAGYRYNELPAAERASLPAEDVLVDALGAAMQGAKDAPGTGGSPRRQDPGLSL